MRTISEQEQRSLKAATDGAYVLGGGISCILPFTRVGVSTLSKYASFNDEHHDSFMPIDVVVEVERRAKSPVIIRQLAALVGYELVPCKRYDEPARAVTEADAHRVLKEAMDVAQAIIAAREDNRIDAAERKIIDKELVEAIRALESVRRALASGEEQ